MQRLKTDTADAHEGACWQDGPIYEFTRRNDVYVLSRKDRLKAKKGFKKKVLIVTVAERKKTFSKHQIDRADQAAELGSCRDAKYRADHKVPSH